MHLLLDKKRGVIMKDFKKSIFTIFIALAIILSAIAIADSVSAEDNAPKAMKPII